MFSRFDTVHRRGFTKCVARQKLERRATATVGARS